MLTKLAPAAIIALSLLVSTTPAHAQNYGGPVFSLLGIDTVIRGGLTAREIGNNGAGITFGVVDTGVISAWTGFQNRVVGGACMISGCSSYADNNGHGTFVASEIVGNIPGSYQGIATAGKLVVEKALGANGSGLVGDVANGINNAVSKGAQVINLSVGFVPTSGLLSAINNAASKGALVVFAAGNDGTAFQSNQRISGLTDQAIKSLLIVGSTGMGKSVSYFSNKPGTGGFVSNTGKFYPFSSLWVMADGEGVYGASTYNGPTGYTYLTTMSGTSMAAPQAAGVAGLLASRWPFLLNKNLVSSVMTATATDLGTAGVDSTYGNGFINAGKAFNPIGELTIPVNGQNIPVSQAQLQVNGTVNGQKIAQLLAAGVGYDSLTRDFKINLGAGVGTNPINNITMNVYTIAAGSTRSFTDLGNDAWLSTSFDDRGGFATGNTVFNVAHTGFMQDPNRPATGNYSAGFYSQGMYIGGGMGGKGTYSFNDARWGEKTAFFNSDLAGASNILGLAEGTSYAAAGFEISKTERLSFGVTMGKNDQLSQLMGNEVSSQGMTVGYTWKPDSTFGISFTGAFLKEKNSLLGSASGGYLKLGEEARTMSAGVSSNLNLGDGLQIGFDALVASTDPTHNSNSLIESTSRLTSAGFGVTLRKENLTGVGDTLIASIKSPLHVIGGHADVNVPTSTDIDGNPVFQNARASLATEGHEMDLTVGYTRPLSENAKASFALELRNDANNVPGAFDHAVMFRINKTF
jgi:subtilisin family serine protease